MQRVLVKPREGLRVLDPATMQALPAKGIETVKNKHWLRREREGDVEITAIKKATVLRVNWRFDKSLSSVR